MSGFYSIAFEPTAFDAGTASAATTAGRIRDRIIYLIEQATPVSLDGDKFRGYRNERAARFREDMETNSAGCFRRVQVRKVGGETPPDVSNMDQHRVRATFEIAIAYPQTHRFGRDAALDRDDVREQDWTAVDRLVGICGRSNFYGTHDCTPLGCEEDWEDGDGVDFMVVTAEFEFMKSTTNS